MHSKNMRKRSISLMLALVIFLGIAGPTKAFADKETVTGRPIVILMEYQDYKFNEIDQKEEWRLRGIPGEDYNRDFVNELLFSPETYKGEDGRDFMSVRSFYRQLTNDTYDFKGEVFGPYTAKHKAAYYGKDLEYAGDDQDNARKLVEEAIEAVAKDPKVDLSKFDVETRVRDRDTNETHISYGKSDGQVDTVIVIHPGLGQEWGGGSLGDDAIWPFRRGFTWYGGDWNLKEYKTKDHKGKEWRFDDFTIIAQDSASDMLIHEFGHVLGLPDLYGFSGSYPPVEKWDIMGGSYTGKDVAGTMPIAYGAYMREWLQESFNEGEAPFVTWTNMIEKNFKDIDDKGFEFVLDQAHDRGEGKTDLLKLQLPEKETYVAKATSGSYMYFSGKGDDLRTSMSSKLDLRETVDNKLGFKAWYKIDPLFDFATVRVKEVGKEDWKTVKGNITTDKVDQWLIDNETEEERLERNPGHGITGDSKGWVDGEFDLSEYDGQEIELSFHFFTDSNTPEEGIYIDDIVVTGLKANQAGLAGEKEEVKEEVEEKKEETSKDKEEAKDLGEEKKEEPKDLEEKLEEEVQERVTVFTDNVEGELKFDLSGGFKKTDGLVKSDHYYLLEWRNIEEGKIDEGLGYAHYQWPNIGYDPGLVIWYINKAYMDAWNRPDQQVADHPGFTHAGVVDSDQNPIGYERADGSFNNDSRGDFNMHDAAFNLRPEKEFYHNWGGGTVTRDRDIFMTPDFNDYYSYVNPVNRQSGLQLEPYGVKALVLEEDADRSRAKIRVMNRFLNNPKVDYSDGLDVKSLKFDEDFVYLEAVNKGEASDLGQYAYIGFIGKDKDMQRVEIKERLSLDGGVYKSDLDFMRGAPEADYRVNFIILNDEKGNSRAIYNSNVHEGYGKDLGEGDFSNRNMDRDYEMTRLEFIKAILDKKAIAYENPVAKAEELGLIEGNKAGDYKLDQPITRATASLMVYRLESRDGMTLQMKELDFIDKDIVPAWALEAMKYTSEKQGFKLYNNLLDPNKTMTKYETIRLIDKAM